MLIRLQERLTDPIIDLQKNTFVVQETDEDCVMPEEDSLLDDQKEQNVEEQKHDYPDDPAEIQFARDVQMVTGAIEKPGKGNFSNENLKRIYTLFLVGGLKYHRGKDEKEEGDHTWHSWGPTDGRKEVMPVASSLCHGSRVLLELDDDMEVDVVGDWIFSKSKQHRYKESIRMAATHGTAIGNDGVKEVKLGFFQAMGKALPAVTKNMMKRIPSTMFMGNTIKDTINDYVIGKTLAEHYGVNLALGGEEEDKENQYIYPWYTKPVRNDGTSGHLYIHIDPMTGALLTGIEQSAPSAEESTVGTDHDMYGTSHNITPTAGCNFPKSKESEKNPLQGIGPDRYIDGIRVKVTQKILDIAEIMVKDFEVSWLSLTPAMFANKYKERLDELKAPGIGAISAKYDEFKLDPNYVSTEIVPPVIIHLDNKSEIEILNPKLVETEVIVIEPTQPESKKEEIQNAPAIDLQQHSPKINLQQEEEREDIIVRVESPAQDDKEKKEEKIQDNLQLLKTEIENIEKNSSKEKVKVNNFVDALNQLHGDLKAEITPTQSKWFNCIKRNPDHNAVMELAKKTAAMVQDLLKSETPEEGLGIIKQFENTTRNSKWRKAIGTVISAAIGFVVGAAVGFVAGVSAGFFTGPGAFISGAVGAVVFGSAAGFFLFKQNTREKNLNTILDAANNYNKIS